jgi:hypothetical protein
MYSSITQTAESIRSEVHSTASQLGSSITQTAESIQSEVHAADSKLSSRITQTANSIKLEVSSVDSRLSSSITLTQGEVAIKADTVTVDAVGTRITNLITGVTTATQLSTNYLYAYQNFNYKNVSCTWVNKTVKDSNGNNIVIHYIGYEN